MTIRERLRPYALGAAALAVVLTTDSGPDRGTATERHAEPIAADPADVSTDATVCFPAPSPLGLEWQVPATVPVGSSATVGLAATTNDEASQILLQVDPGPASLDGDLQVEIDMPMPGVEYVTEYEFATNGLLEGSVFADGTIALVGACDDDPRSGARAAFYWAAGDDLVFLSSESLFAAHLDRIAHALSEGAITELEAAIEVDELLSVEVELAPTDGAPAPPPGSTGLVSGTFTWAHPSTSTALPVRNAVVEIYEPVLFGLLTTKIGETPTDATGSFSFDASSFLAPDEKAVIRCRARNPRARAAATGIFASIASLVGDDTWCMEVEAEQGVPFSAKALTTGPGAGAFSIIDACLEAPEILVQAGFAPPAQITVNFPVGEKKAFFSPGSVEISIGTQYPYAWDIVLHEYGHYVDFSFGLTQSAGGFHAFCDDLTNPTAPGNQGPLSQSTANRLAFREAFASVFGLGAQLVAGTSIPGVSSVGDDSLDYLYANGVVTGSYDMEVQSNACTTIDRGEDDELGMHQLLWDLADSSADFPSESANLGFPGLLTLLASVPGKSNGLTDFSQQYQATLTFEEELEYGEFLVATGVSARPVTPVDGTVIPASPPKFTWDIFGRNAPMGPDLDRYVVRVFDEMGGELLSSDEIVGAYEWTPTAAEWETVTDEMPGKIYWRVDGSSDVSGAYPGEAFKMGGVDYAFVIDVTGSMSEEIAGVRNALSAFVAAIPPSTDPPIFQLTTFTDSVFVGTPTDDLAAIQSQINGLGASGGGDCPEASVPAIKQGTVQMAKNGLVQFATDADSQPGTSLESTIAQLKASGVRFNALVSGSCSSPLGLAPVSGSYQQQDEGGAGTGEQLTVGFTPPLPAIPTFALIASETGGTFSYVPEVNFFGSGKQLYENIAKNQLLAALSPTLVQSLPNEAPLGSTIALTLRGQGTNFNATSTVTLDGGIVTLDSEVVDATTIEVVVAVPASTSAGFYDVQVATQLGSATETAVGLGLVEVVPAPTFPVLLSAAPPTLAPGESTTVDLWTLGVDLSEVEEVSFGNGVEVVGFTATSPDVLAVDVVVDETASTGFRLVTLTGDFGALQSTEVDFVLVQPATAALPQIDRVEPSTGLVGTKLMVVIDLMNIDLGSVGSSGVSVSSEDPEIEFVVVEACGQRVVVEMTIGSSAAAGFKDLVVSTPEGTAVRPDGFEVVGESAAYYLALGSVPLTVPITTDDVLLVQPKYVFAVEFADLAAMEVPAPLLGYIAFAQVGEVREAATLAAAIRLSNGVVVTNNGAGLTSWAVTSDPEHGLSLSVVSESLDEEFVVFALDFD